MLSIFRFVINLLYVFVFYKYISMRVRQYFHFKKNLISKLMQPSDTKYGLGTAIAKA
ncbi:hypothetical protein ACINWC487_0198 [Acinetobacter nosocomialis]|nr:hypothetical protein ACINWC487_0198 [Acinetobacter nosocomialis]